MPGLLKPEARCPLCGDGLEALVDTTSTALNIPVALTGSGISAPGSVPFAAGDTMASFTVTGQ